MQEITIDSIRVSLSNYQRVVILKLKSKDLYIPIWVGSNEADSIAVKLQKVKLPRPLTHDLMITLLEKLDVSIEYVLVDSMKNETFYSKIAFKINNKIEMIDSRASDAIALAVRFSCPIYVNDEVVNNVGVSLDHLAKTAQNNAQKSLNKNNNSETYNTEVSEFSDFINSLDLDNFGK
ncbi:MAG: bifunctional nuclease family protein [Dehalococcoidia bacterium]